jgi:glycosyltransferase involved in cell wall biosynthesis
VVKLVEEDAVSKSTQSNPEKFMFLTAWNEWNEQSTFEPNDIDGYDALSIVKKTIRRPTGKLIVHLHRESGPETERYIRDLRKLFQEYDHEEVDIDHALPAPSNCALLHIHGGLVGVDPGREATVIKSYQSKGARIVLSVQDFHWLAPDSPYNPKKQPLTPERAQKTSEIFSMVDQLIFPSVHLKKAYESALEAETGWKHAVVVPPPDILVDYNYLSVPPIRDKTLHVAFVGRFSRPKAAGSFLKLAQKLTQLGEFTVQYHVFGSVSTDVICFGTECAAGSQHKKDLRNIIFHGPFRERSLPLLLSSRNVHVLVSLSLVPEVYSYALSHFVNSGLPLVYSSSGSTPERLEASYVTSSLSTPSSLKYYPLSDPKGLLAVMTRCLGDVLTHAGSSNRNHTISDQLQPSKWYISHYPLGR